MRLLILLIFLILATYGCNQSKETQTVKTQPQLPAHIIVNVSDEKLTTVDWVATTVKIMVNPSITKEELEKLLNVVLVEHYDRNTPLGPTQHFTIQAYNKDDIALKSVVGSVSQVPPHRIAFSYSGIITYDRDEKINYTRERTKEEEERDAYVGKVATELVKEAGKIRDRK